MVHVGIHEVADVRHHRDLRVDEGVLAAEAPDRKTGRVEALPRRHGVDPVRGTVRLFPQLDCNPFRGEELQGAAAQQRRHHGVDVNMVRMFVGDQHGVGPGQGLVRLGEGPRVQHQDPAVFLQADTGVGEFRELHRASLSIRRRSVHGPGW